MLVVAIWSQRVLGANWSGVVRIVEGQHLVQKGRYAVVRNPIYSGMAYAAFGTALVAGTVGVAFVVVSLWQKSRKEERRPKCGRPVSTSRGAARVRGHCPR